jgi:hypothetical protein
MSCLAGALVGTMSARPNSKNSILSPSALQLDAINGRHELAAYHERL